MGFCTRMNLLGPCGKAISKLCQKKNEGGEKNNLSYIWKQSERLRLDITNFHMGCFTNEAWNCRKWEHVSCENGQSGKQIRCFGHRWHQLIINWFRTLVAVIRLREIRITKTESRPAGNCNCVSVWDAKRLLVKMWYFRISTLVCGIFFLAGSDPLERILVLTKPALM